jgi:hypothetical protein
MTHSSKRIASADAPHPQGELPSPVVSRFDEFLILPRWRIAAMYWFAQSLVLFFLIPAVGLLSSSVDAGSGNYWGHIHFTEYHNLLVNPDTFQWVAGFVIVITVAQAIMLLPVRRPTFRTTGGTSLKLAITIVVLCIGLMAAAAVIAVVHTSSLYIDSAAKFALGPGSLGCLLAVWITSWVLIARFMRKGPRDTRLARLTSRLFLGTLIETAAIIPLDVLVRRKESCYCFSGTLLALITCGTVGFIALGPAIVLPFIARRRKHWYAQHCEVCGYDLAPTPHVLRCPECGTGWKSHDLTPLPPLFPLTPPPPQSPQ